MRVSEHFSLEELTFSPTAKRLGIDNKPNETIINRLRYLCENVLEPVRKLYGKPIVVTSGFRCEKLNKAVGGSGTSQHVKGEAADIRSVSDTPQDNKELYDCIIKSGVVFDQLIDEFGYDWIHVSYTKQRENRKQKLKAVRKSGKTIYLRV
jgi:hypothetical protein